MKLTRFDKNKINDRNASIDKIFSNKEKLVPDFYLSSLKIHQ